MQSVQMYIWNAFRYLFLELKKLVFCFALILGHTWQRLGFQKSLQLGLRDHLGYQGLNPCHSLLGAVALAQPFRFFFPTCPHIASFFFLNPLLTFPITFNKLSTLQFGFLLWDNTHVYTLKTVQIEHIGEGSRCRQVI